MSDPQDFIRKYLSTDLFADAITPLAEDVDISMWEFEFAPDQPVTRPRIEHPSRQPRNGYPLDNKPGVVDHTGIKSILRKSGWME